MRIHTLDVASPPSPLITSSSSHFSRASLDLCDAVLWNPQLFHTQLARDGMELSLSASTDMFVASRHWRAAFDALWQRGGTVVVFLPANAIVQAHHFEDLIDLNLLDALGADAPLLSEFTPVAGAMQPGGDPFHDFFAQTAGAWAPVSTLRHESGSAVLRAADRSVVASYKTRGSGRLLLLPQLAHAMSAPILEAISLLIARLADPSSIVNAGWLADVPRSATAKRVAQRDEYCQRIAELKAKVVMIDAAQRADDLMAQLVAGTGRGVYRAVFDALRRRHLHVEKDWLDESWVILRGDVCVRLFKTVVFGEALDNAALDRIELDVARMAQESDGVLDVTIIDCRTNVLPLSARPSSLLPDEAKRIASRGWKHCVGAEIFILVNEAHAPSRIEELYVRVARILAR